MKAQQSSANSQVPSTVSGFFMSMKLQEHLKTDVDDKSYVEYGPFFCVVLSFIYESGALLGFGLRNNVELLTKLLKLNNPSSSDTIAAFKKIGNDYLSGLEGEPCTLADIWVTPTLKKAGLYLDKNIKDFRKKIKEMTRKSHQPIYDLQYIADYSQIAFFSGASIGCFYSKLFKRCWNEYYKLKPLSEWEEAYRYGVVDSPIQERISFEEQLSNVLLDTLDWYNFNISPLLTSEESVELNRIAKNPVC